jgi:phosphatidylglycerophosphate synthase
MNSPHLAVILLSPTKNGHSLLLENKIAGVPLFKRLILTLQRAGIDEILVLSHQLGKQEISAHQKDIEKDSRFTSLLHWHDHGDYFATYSNAQAELLTQSKPFVLVNGNLVTHQKVIRQFTEAVENKNPDGIFCLDLERGKPGGLYLLPPTHFSTLNYHTGMAGDGNKPEHIKLPSDKNFWTEVQDHASARQAEKNLLRHSKNHYTQFMDIWFNSFFSTPISAVLVKTPLTPNMLSLFGMCVGFLAGVCFAQGNYLSGLAGGLLLTLTAILDCCDGDVARLKFLESDFGEKLDTICDNLINVFAFTGIMMGVSQTQGWGQALIPFIMLVIGGGLIFAFIYFPKGGKGSVFKDSEMYDLIQILASRNFIYIILIFSLIGHLEWFLWLGGIGSLIFALMLFIVRRQSQKHNLPEPLSYE